MSTIEHIYSLTNCPFCDSELKYKYTHHCPNNSCSYDYEVYSSGIIDFLVPGYIIEIHSDPPKTKIILDGIDDMHDKDVANIDHILWIDNNNYKEVINRIIKLKTFC